MSGSEPTQTEVSLDESALKQYLETQLGSVDRYAVTPQEAGSGSSNQTFFVEWGDEEYVLRGAPDHERVPYLLHDVVEEYEILSAMADTEIPAPDPVTVCPDTSVLGTPFYLMEQVSGEALADDEPARFADPSRRRRVGEIMVDTLATVHTLEPEGFEIRDAPAGMPAEAVEAHTANLEEALETTGRELTRALEVGDWLHENIPDSPDRTIVHGDYKTDNLLFAPGTPPRIAAVLDWEMAGIGDPLADLGWFLALWPEEKDPDPITSEFRDRYSDHDQYDIIAEDTSFMKAPGYPTRSELVQRYEKQTGLEYRHDRFYRALGLYKLTTICEKFHEAYLTHPETAKATYPVMEVLAPYLAERAALIVEGKTPL